MGAIGAVDTLESVTTKGTTHGAHHLVFSTAAAIAVVHWPDSLSWTHATLSSLCSRL